jgi:hypothetical protein
MIKAKITNSINKDMTGTELRRLRILAGLGTEALADRMAEWGWYRWKVRDLESKKKEKFSLHPDEMISLLNALGASSL